jgi:hypothetical protein
MEQTTLELQCGAYLQESSAGEVLLYFRDVVYSAEDAVPEAIYTASDTVPLTIYQYGRIEDSQARAFVDFCMTWAFGTEEASWPPLAQRFIGSNENVLPESPLWSDTGNAPEE